MTGKLREKAKDVAAQAIEARADIGKDAVSDTEDMLRRIRLDWDDIAEDLMPLLQQIAADGVTVAARQLSAEIGLSLDQANERAIAWAKDRAAELVGKKWVDGELVNNPNAAWSIEESTRDLLRADVTRAMEEGLSNDALAAIIEENYAFSESRAEMIARTETAIADTQGNVEAYKEAEKNGIVIYKEWLTADDDAVSEECAINGESEPIPMDEAFPSGAMWPPEHPNCRCAMVPVVQEEE